MMSLLWISFSLFLLMDAFGNIPLYIAVLKEIPPKKHRWIIFRELLIALVVIIIFNFIGEGLLAFLHVTSATVQVAGGVILFILALKMIFPDAKRLAEPELTEITEPFIVPLAIPLVAGPAVLAAVMLFTHQEQNNWIMVGAIVLAWLATLLILLLAPTFSKYLGKRGIIALERLMGFILVLISVEMFLNGISEFLKNQ